MRVRHVFGVCFLVLVAAMIIALFQAPGAAARTVFTGSALAPFAGLTVSVFAAKWQERKFFQTAGRNISKIIEPQAGESAIYVSFYKLGR